MTETRIIKKYANRRLYDTSRGAYITLDDVKQLVYDQVDFQVVDARSHKDLTQSTLLQIIAEQEASHTPIFTTPILQQFIRFYQEKSQSLLTRYLEDMMKSFLQQKNVLQQQWATYQHLLPAQDLLKAMLWPPQNASNNSKITKSTKNKSKRQDK